MTGRTRLFLAACLALAGLGEVAAAEPGLPPLRSFFRNADIGAAKLSPDGRWIAVTTATDARRFVLTVIDLEHKVEPAVAASFADADVEDFHWLNDRHLVLRILDRERGAGDQRFGAGLFAVSRDGREFKTVVDPVGHSGPFRNELGSSVFRGDHFLMAVPFRADDHIVVGQARHDARGDLEYINPFRVNLVSGEVRSMARGAPAGAQQWLFDPDGEARVAVTQSRGEQEVFWKGPGDTSWRSLVKQPVNDAAFHPVSVDGAGQLFVTTRGPAGQSVLARFDFATGKPGADPVVSAPGFDFRGNVITDRASQQALGVRVHTDAESTVWFDAHLKAVQAAADARFPGRVNRLSCHVCSPDSNILVFSFSDQDPGSYWVHRPAGGAWEPVGKRRRDIDPRRMAQLDLHRIRSRDGHDLPVWVTVPPGPATGPRPAIVLVHGGPWLRGGFWHWDADAQFLASRGYVVIEPEFRGSLGYGASHFQRGFKQWGAAMQDDVADALQWAVGKGLVDGNRACIAGASYGGYSTLMSLVRHPDLYRCGVAWVAVSDPRLFMAGGWASDVPQEARRYSLPQLIGDLEKDAEMLKAASPPERAKEIRAPLLMAFGGKDRRVPLEHGTRMRDALRAAGQTPEWVVYDDEAHGWLKVENRIDFWQRVETFLARHLR